MLNIYTLICSNRKNGVNTLFSRKINEKLINEFSQKGIKANTTTKLISDYNVAMCSGCQKCFDKGYCCCYVDDQITFIHDLGKADIIVFCVPVYINNIPGSLKVLLDRIGYLVHLMPFLGKSGILLTTTSLSGSAMVESYMEMVFSYLGISTDLKLRYYDQEKCINDSDNMNIHNYVENYVNNNIKVPTLLSDVFMHYYNHYLPYKNKHINNSELIYWQENYLKYDGLDELLKNLRHINK